jgi:photosystem II stability/assembly factor-like uncharacterized protein
MSRILLLVFLAAALFSIGASVVFVETDLEEQAEVEHVLARESHFYLQRAYPFRQIPPDARLRAVEQLNRDMNSSMLAVEQTRRWQPIGPEFLPNGQPIDFNNSPPISVSGRATAIAIDPSNSNKIFLGTAQGGVWRSDDAGASWKPIADDLPSLAVGSLSIDPRNPNVIFLGTGEANFSSLSYYGAGLFKSTDGGSSWARAGQLPTRVCISRIVFEPGNSQTLYAATSFARTNSARPIDSFDSGVFKSIDGGASWNKVLDGIATDLVANPSSPAELFAAIGDPFGNQMNGIYRSTNAGGSWQLVETLPRGLNTGRIELARSPSSPNILFASVARVATEGLMNLFKSVDGGNSWAVVSDAPNYCASQCFFNNFVAVHPTDPSVVFLGGVPLFRSTDGGISYTNVSSPKQFGPGLHADNHAIAFDPQDRNKIYVANDGGIFRSSDLGNSWTSLNNGLSTFQFQSVVSHPLDGNRAIGGTQDNGTLLYTGMPAWRQIDTGDGGETAIDPNIPDTLYHFYFFLLLARSDDGGQRFSIKTTGLPVSSNGFPLERSQFYAPLVIDPVNSNTLYTGSIRVFRTTSRGEIWMPISSDLTKGIGSISAIAVASSDPNVICAGTSDGNLARTTDGGTSWQSINSGLPNRFVTRLVIDPSSPQTVYVTFSGFGSGHVFKTTNGGQSWVNISDNLPDLPVNAMALDTGAAGVIYVATDIGVFVSRTGGGNWRMLSQGLPMVAVFDLDLNRRTGRLIAATHGRGMFSLPLDGIDDNTSPQVSVESPKGGERFNAGDSVEIRWSATDDSGVASQNIDLSIDGGASFSVPVASGLAGDLRSFNLQVPDLSTTQARVRISARDSAGNTGTGSSASNFTIAAPPRPVIGKVQFKNGGNGKLIIDGEGFIVDDTVIEVDGRQLQTTKYPKAFRKPDGSATRLQGVDSQLKQLIQPGKKVNITLLNKSTGRRSIVFEFSF